MRVRSALVVAALAGLPAAAGAQTISWASATSGDWNTAANWSPMDVPNAASENAVLGLSGAYTVSYDTTTTIGSLMITNPNATLDVMPIRVLAITADSTNNGLIVVNGVNSVSNAALQASASFTLGGTGELLMGGGPNDAQINTNGAGTTLTQGQGHTIRGSGEINALFVNNGLVRAEVIGTENTIVFQTGNPKTNNADIQAGPGAVISIISTTINQGPDGVILADGGLVTLSGTTTLNGGTIDSTSGGFIERQPGTTTAVAVTNEGDLELRGNGNLNVSGGLTNNGTIYVNPENNPGNATFQFLDSATLSGTGTMILGGGPNDAQVNTVGAGTTLTNAATHTIRGSGEINGTLVNNGLVRAEVIGTENTIVFQTGSPKTNNADIQAGPGAVISISATTINQSPAGVILADGGLVTLSGTNTLNGGTIDSTSGGFVERQPGTTTAVAVTNEGDLELRGNGVVNVSGGLTNNGTIYVNPENSPGNAFFQFLDSATLSGTGTMILGGGPNDAQVNTVGAGTTLTNAATHTIRGSGEINGTLVNNGLVRAEVIGDENTIVFQTGNVKTNNADIQAGPGAVITISATTINQGPAGVILADGGLVTLSSTNTIEGGTIDTANGGLVERQPGTGTIRDVTIDGNTEIRSGGVFNVTIGLTVNGTLTVNPENGLSNAFFQVLDTLTIDGTGTIALGGGTGDAQFTTTGGAVATIGPDVTVTGEGDIKGDFIQNGMTEPGIDGTGPLHVFQNLTLTDSAVTTFQIAALNDHDTLVLSSTSLVLDGTLVLEFLDGYHPQVGDEFVLASGSNSTVTGSFDNVVIIGDNEQRIRITQGPNELVIGYTCLTDINGDFVLNNTDINAFVNGFLNQLPIADINNDGFWNNTDINLFVNLFLGGCV